ncbi:Uncharacterized protein OS=Arthrospira platensis C1 GN=SPLC1_S551150 PE=4 SV=1: DDE_3 [Gemmata massiliana]|uniref:Tc1-like transposase DDE domain-containing protein n=1 Tax=Gemmata massiliana TaxID=1210884 RepID=A0A6P2DCM8_9BACT|nr:hypothetical protein [Gemmata massiliana]VTR98518.1 Uncharacterized protein OS=Arthrospira platensis C1 GN=SPLC1_S551150 PE=4 SV=1: DDE_3 [Gemmata massiliana]
MVLVDNVGWHTARALVVPPNMVLHFVPPCTPELQPAEPLWPLVREAVANRSLGRIDRLRASSATAGTTSPSTPKKCGPGLGSAGLSGWNGNLSKRFGIITVPIEMLRASVISWYESSPSVCRTNVCRQFRRPQLIERMVDVFV